MTLAINIGAEPLTIEDVINVAEGGAHVLLSTDASWRRTLAAGVEQLERHLREENRVYGVTTGVGDSCETTVPSELSADLQANLVRFHGVGTGALFSEAESAAAVMARIGSLRLGWSAVRELLLQRLCDLVNHRILPCIPCEGSVGASGDLTPLSYVGAALIGERDVYFRGAIHPAAVAWQSVGIAPITLHPKEALAIMNGTSVMTGLVCLAFGRAARLSRFAASLGAMLCDVTGGNPAHFDDRLFLAKPHPGQRAVARWMREDIEYRPSDGAPKGRIQDRYSLRCAPHVIGVLVDALPYFRTTIEIELNGASDNPLIDPVTGDVLHGGNFYGGHIAFVADSLKTAVANLADLMDRQMALVCNPTTSGGLPANLVAATGASAGTHHGFKAMSIATSALAAEALKLTMPASAFSRSTECHNQDKVSMGTIAARDCLRVLELTETVAAILVLALSQAADIRRDEGCHSRTRRIRDSVRAQIPPNVADRAMDGDIRTTLRMFRTGALPIGESDFP